MNLLRAKSRPMMRVEMLLLIVVGFLMAAVNGSWWASVMAGRSWSDPQTWLFMAACFVALAALHFALFASMANRWIVRPLLIGLLTLTVSCCSAMLIASVVPPGWDGALDPAPASGPPALQH